jgi:hypothetical protein
MTRKAGVALLADVVFVLVFAAIGRHNHEESSALVGIAKTAWPFLVGLALGWVAMRAWRRPTAIWPEGAVVWVSTVAAGMVLRVVSGADTAFSFIVVATIVLGVFLLGWRAVVRLLHRHSALA